MQTGTSTEDRVTALAPSTPAHARRGAQPLPRCFQATPGQLMFSSSGARVRAGGLSGRTIKQMEIKREGEVGGRLSRSVNTLRKTYAVQPIPAGSSGSL